MTAPRSALLAALARGLNERFPVPDRAPAHPTALPRRGPADHPASAPVAGPTAGPAGDPVTDPTADLAAWARAQDPHVWPLFAALDCIYLLHTLSLLPELPPPTLHRWWQRIAADQCAADGWFRGTDRQRHSPIHVTAYALGAFHLLAAAGDGTPLATPPRTPVGIRPCAPQQALAWRGADALGPLQRLHFWRGSHRIGGMIALRALSAEPALGGPGSASVAAELGALVRAWFAVADPASGCWVLAPRPLQCAFDTLFSPRHRPEHCRIGAAAHLYWAAARLGVPCRHPAAALATTRQAQGDDGRFEAAPYCLDYDALAIARHAVASAPAAAPSPAAARHAQPDTDAQIDAGFSAELDALARANRTRIEHIGVQGEQGGLWARGLHGAVGALAAVALADRILGDRRTPLADPLATTWWL